MSTGRVESLHALLPVAFRLKDRPDLTIEYVVDTGFTGFLTLPLEAVELLQLPYLQDVPANLADDSQVALPVHLATVKWCGRERDVRVIATGRRPCWAPAYSKEPGYWRSSRRAAW